MALTKITNDGVDFSGTTDINIDSGTFVVDASTDRVGVGTSSPASKLHLNESTGAGTFLRVQNTGGSAYYGVDGSGDAYAGSISADNFKLYTNASPRLTIDSSGNVGVGTASPSRKLSVYDASLPVLSLHNSGTGTTTSDGFQVQLSSLNAYLWNYEAGATIFGTNNTERLRIDSGGRVGIGTSSPGSFYSGANQLVVGDGAGGRGITIYTSSTENGYLTFNDTGDTSSQGWIGYDHSINALKLASNGADRVRIDSSGNVGIGTTSPDYRLDVSGGPIGIAEGQALTWHNGSGSNSAQIYADSGDTLYFRNTSSNTERMRIDSSGRLGIGTSSPNSLLTLDNNADSASISTSAGNYQIRLRAAQFNTYNGGICTTETTTSAVSAAISPIDTGSGGAQGWAFITGNNSAIAERLRIANTGAFGLSGANYGTSGQVLTSQGSGSAPQWATVSASTSVAVLADVKTQNTAGGTFTSGAWRTRDLNTEQSDPDGIVSLSSNRFTLAAGTYLIQWECPAYRVGRHQSRLWDVTDTAEVEKGMSIYDDSSELNTGISPGSAVVTITSDHVYEIQHYSDTSKVGNGLGVEANISYERYTRVTISKIA